MARKSRQVGKDLSTQKRGSQQKLSAEDKDLWQMMTEDVSRLKQHDPKISPDLAPLPTQKLVEEDEMGLIVRAPDPVYFDHHDNFYPSVAPEQIGHLSEVGLQDMDKRQQERFRKGKLPIEARLDLHHMTQKQALKTLTRFIPEQRVIGHRVVIVITGKGAPVLKMSSQRNPYQDPEHIEEEGRHRGVLRDMVPVWMNSPSLKPHILAFCRAQPSDGGSGALYVMLKKWRK